MALLHQEYHELAQIKKLPLICPHRGPRPDEDGAAPAEITANAPSEIPIGSGNDAAPNDGAVPSHGAAGSSSDIAIGRRLPEAGSVTARTSTPTSAAASHQRAFVPAETGVITEPQEWTAFDLGHASKLLKSSDEGVLRRALRRLHVRYWHTATDCLKELLSHELSPIEAQVRVLAKPQLLVAQALCPSPLHTVTHTF